MDISTASLSPNEEIKPYKIHVSSKYLDLTKKKLELTRLPHELLIPAASVGERERGGGVREGVFGTEKKEIEPLIDFWLEQYTWRSRESHLNHTLPQYRTSLPLPSSNSPLLRIHFIHLRSPHENATPLLLLPPFPLTPLSLTGLYKRLTHPFPSSSSSSSPTEEAHAFHLVIPSIPGLGFSDAFSALTSQTTLLRSTASLFNTLMLRLGYAHYLVSATGGGGSSPAGIDFHLARLVGEYEACLGTHYIGPLWEKPTFLERGKGSGTGRGVKRGGLWDWLKWQIVWAMKMPIWGYTKGDFTALKNGRLSSLGVGAGFGRIGAVGQLGLRESNTLAYALCDSPVGLLSLVCSALRRVSPDHRFGMWDVVDAAQLAWLPGPEAGIRFWSAAVAELELERCGVRGRGDGEEGLGVEGQGRAKGKKKLVAVTVFIDDQCYTPPAWAPSDEEVTFAQRVDGKAGLVAWERIDVIVSGIQGLAREVAARDGRLKLVPLERVVVDGEEDGDLTEEFDEESSLQLDVESPDTVVAVDMS